ncbi:hypothetical protein FSARC_2695 [Fusarium sarcochroum]|uniref:6-methylsalicylate decarboxylase n=1 Tax=Fusarium sarcochroum TaxID=1208366 RepID=A0A8H4U5H3_9HYPO|nr:hypothetical protein FSARC_2695 [Fusarium sarcochroum]
MKLISLFQIHLTLLSLQGASASASCKANAPRSSDHYKIDGKIDVHAHFLPEFYREALNEAGQKPGFDGMPFAPNWTIEDHLGFMNERDVQKSYLSISSPGVYLNVPSKEATKKAISLSRRINQYASKLKAKYPKRIGFFASLPLPDVDASLKEINYCFTQLNPKPDGIVLMSNYYGLYLGDPDLDPIYEALNRLNITIFEHPTTPCTQANAHQYNIDDENVPAVSAQKWQAVNRPLAIRQVTAPMLEFPFDTARAVTDLIFSDVPARFPSLKWIIPHDGGALISTLDRVIEFSFQRPKLTITEESIKETFAKSFYFDLAGPWPVSSAIPALLRWASSDRIVWGSDVPFTPWDSAGETAVKFDQEIQETLEDPSDVEAVKWKNAKKLFA